MRENKLNPVSTSRSRKAFPCFPAFVPRLNGLNLHFFTGEHCEEHVAFFKQVFGDQALMRPTNILRSLASFIYIYI